MEQLPVDIHIVSDGEKAIDFISRAESEPDAPCPHLLLLDLNLPRRDGFEVLRRLRESAVCKNIPVMIITSSDSAVDRGLAADLGAGYFQKTPDYEEFMKVGAALRQLLTDNGML